MNTTAERHSLEEIGNVGIGKKWFRVYSFYTAKIITRKSVQRKKSIKKKQKQLSIKVFFRFLLFEKIENDQSSIVNAQ